MNLVRLTNVFPFVPSHNNNQPFNNVNLAINDIELTDEENNANNGGGGQRDRYSNNEHVTVYSLYDEFEDGVPEGVVPMSADDGGVVGEGNNNTADEGEVEDLKFIPNEFGFLEMMDDDDDGSSSGGSSEEEASGCDSEDDDSDDGGGDGDPECSLEVEKPAEEEEEDLEVVSCVTCGCFGVTREFHDQRHCTYDCAVVSRINEGKRLRGSDEGGDLEADRKRMRLIRVVEEEIQEENQEEDDEEEEDDDDDDDGDSRVSTSSGSSDSGRGTGRSGSSSGNDEGGGVAVENLHHHHHHQMFERVRAPVWLFRAGAFPTALNPFRVNDVLEAIDPEHQSLFCPCIVVEVIGFRMLLKFIGFPDKYNFWVNADSTDIFPVNWSTRYRVTKEQVTAASSSSSQSRPPLHFHGPDSEFTWEGYLEHNASSRVAPESSFRHIKRISDIKDTPVRVGMKLEAVDVRNQNLVCVATVSCVMGDRFLVHFDSWDSLYDYWTDLNSPFVHPVGYCASLGIEITPPHCYENAAEFEWDEYLKKTGSVPVPSALFRPNPPLGFRVGHLLEVVDKRSPRLLRRATVTETDAHFLTLHFDALKSTLYDYKVYEQCPEIHPVGWGAHTGHPIADSDGDSSDDEDENEALRNNNERFPVCPNHKVCKSVCSVKGPNHPVHSNVKHCPYSPPNLTSFEGFSDRVVVFEDKYYDLGGGGDDGKSDNDASEEEEEEDDEEETPQVKPEVVKIEPVEIPPPPPQQQQQQQAVNKPGCSYQPLHFRSTGTPINFHSSVVKVLHSSPPQQLSNSGEPLPKRSEILTWSHDKISNLVQNLCSNLPTAQKVADQFRSNLIDGESFLMLTQSDMTDALGIKLGPAVKIFNLIRLIDLNK